MRGGKPRFLLEKFRKVVDGAKSQALRDLGKVQGGFADQLFRFTDLYGKKVGDGRAAELLAAQSFELGNADLAICGDLLLRKSAVQILA